MKVRQVVVGPFGSGGFINFSRAVSGGFEMEIKHQCLLIRCSSLVVVGRLCDSYRQVVVSGLLCQYRRGPKRGHTTCIGTTHVHQKWGFEGLHVGG